MEIKLNAHEIRGLGKFEKASIFVVGFDYRASRMLAVVIIILPNSMSARRIASASNHRLDKDACQPKILRIDRVEALEPWHMVARVRKKRRVGNKWKFIVIRFESIGAGPSRLPLGIDRQQRGP